MNDSVLLPVPSWITNNETNWPATPFVPAPKALLPPRVTLATGLACTSQETVEPSVKVASGKYAASLNLNLPVPFVDNDNPTFESEPSTAKPTSLPVAAFVSSAKFTALAVVWNINCSLLFSSNRPWASSICMFAEFVSKSPPSWGVVSSTRFWIPEPDKALTDVKLRPPEPSVFKTWSASPSLLGSVKVDKFPFENA